MTTLVGREREIAILQDRVCVEDVRLLTLAGTGGVGKTRLAQAVASEVSNRFHDGVFFIDLQPISNPALLMSAIALALGLRETGARKLVDSLLLHLRDRSVLLVLDNCEQLLEAAAQVAQLLEACPKLRVLATSREPLRVASERVHPVPPLELPDLRFAHSMQAIADAPAVSLFIQRAKEVTPTFQLTEDTSRAVAELCIRMDGIPLAIELAAAHSRALPPQALLARMEQLLDLLIAGRRDAPGRHRSLRSALDWSYSLLSAEEQALFRRVAIFVGGWTLEAAEAICPDPREDAHGREGPILIRPGGVPSTLAQLVDKSLVVADELAPGAVRYRLLETVRSYGLEVMGRAGEAGLVASRHNAWCLALAEAAESHLRGPDQEAWRAQLESEHDNLRAALAWAQAQGQTEAMLSLAGALGQLWLLWGYLAEGEGWLDAALDRNADAPDRTRARALTAAGYITYRRGDFVRAQARFDAALAAYRRLGNQRGMASALHGLGMLALARGEFAVAETRYREALALAREAGDLHQVAETLSSLMMAVERVGNVAEALGQGEESLTLFQRMGDRQGMSKALMHLGIIAADRHDPAAGAVRHREALALAREVKDPHATSLCLANLAEYELALGSVVDAARHTVEAMVLAGNMGNTRVLRDCVELAAGILAHRGEAVAGARLLGLSDAWAEMTGWLARWGEELGYGPTVARLRQQLGEAELVQIRAAGRQLDPARTVEAVSGALSGVLNGPTPTAKPARLTTARRSRNQK